MKIINLKSANVKKLVGKRRDLQEAFDLGRAMEREYQEALKRVQ